MQEKCWKFSQMNAKRIGGRMKIKWNRILPGSINDSFIDYLSSSTMNILHRKLSHTLVMRRRRCLGSCSTVQGITDELQTDRVTRNGLSPWHLDTLRGLPDKSVTFLPEVLLCREILTHLCKRSVTVIEAAVGEENVREVCNDYFKHWLCLELKVMKIILHFNWKTSFYSLVFFSFKGCWMSVSFDEAVTNFKPAHAK